jgi:hypothetical protein
MILANQLPRFEECVVFVDDVRGFSDMTETNKYPSKEFLVEWANANDCSWSIEHDIFIAKKLKLVR